MPEKRFPFTGRVEVFVPEMAKSKDDADKMGRARQILGDADVTVEILPNDVTVAAIAMFAAEVEAKCLTAGSITGEEHLRLLGQILTAAKQGQVRIRPQPLKPGVATDVLMLPMLTPDASVPNEEETSADAKKWKAILEPLFTGLGEKIASGLADAKKQSGGAQ